MKDLENEPNLTEWEHGFVHSNLERTEFTDKQKESIARPMEKYEIS